MLYQPSYPSPYLSDIDANQTNEFSCYINADGGTSVTSYKYSISDINGTNIYTSSVIPVSGVYADEILTFEVPTSVGLANGLDYMWNITLYESNPDIWIVYGTVQSGDNTTTQVCLRASYLIEAGMYLNVNNQLKLIDSYDSSTGIVTLASALTSVPKVGSQYNVYSNNVTSTNYYFKARTTPTLTMATVPDIIDGKSYTFTATYSQEENVGYKYYEWTIYDEGGNVLTTSGQINTGLIKYTFDGFITGNGYGVSLTLVTQDDITINISPKWFKVVYEQPQIDNPPVATTNCDNDSIDLVWSPLFINAGQAVSTTGETPSYDYVADTPYLGGSSVRIASGTNLYWHIGSELAPIYTPYESTTFINWHTSDANFTGTIYKQEGEYVDFVAMSATTPATATTGDKYYNTLTKLIYSAIGTNMWSSSGDEPREDVIYRNTITSVNYAWIDGDMVATSDSLPSYTITYQDGKFYYDIVNDGVDISSSVELFKQSDWLLQPETREYALTYIWVDEAIWDDDLFWTDESEVLDISQFWFKFTLLPTELKSKALLITATTWDDLANYTWNGASAFTWNQLVNNKV